jgi:hypothetical protein
MELYKNENENRNFILDKFKKSVQNDKDYKDFLIDKEVPVPYRQIYLPWRKELEICCFKQDICIYQKLFDKSVGYNKAKIKVADKEILSVVLNKNATATKDIGLPFVIIETKMVGKTNTHGLLACSDKIKMIKTIFPYCTAYLLCFGSFNPNVYRHCSGFDQIFFIGNLNDKCCADIIDKIKGGFDNAWWKMVPGALEGLVSQDILL